MTNEYDKAASSLFEENIDLGPLSNEETLVIYWARAILKSHGKDEDGYWKAAAVAWRKNVMKEITWGPQ